MSLIRAISSLSGKASLLMRPQMLATMGSSHLINTFEKMSLSVIPVMPKRPTNGYTIFYKEISPKIMEQNPGIRAKDLIQMIAQEWNKLDKNSKEEYLAKGKLFLNEYKLEKEKFLKSLTQKQTEVLKNSLKDRKKSLAKRRLKAQLKKLDYPLRSKSAYTLFVKESVLKRRGDVPIKERFKQISKEWKTLTDSQKAPYFESARNDKIRYMQEMEKWKNSMTTPENEAILNKLADLRSISSGRAKRSAVPRVKKVKKLAKTKPKSKKAKSSKAKLTKTKSTKSKSKSTKSASKTKKVKTGAKKKKVEKSESVEVKDETSSSSEST